MPSQIPAGLSRAQKAGAATPLCRQRWHRDVLLPAWHCHLSAEPLGSVPSLLSPAAQPEWLDVISDTEADIGSDLRWSCVASGKPRPAVRWLRDGQPLTSQVPPKPALIPLLQPQPLVLPRSCIPAPVLTRIPPPCAPIGLPSHGAMPKLLSPGAAIPAIASCSCRDSSREDKQPLVPVLLSPARCCSGVSANRLTWGCDCTDVKTIAVFSPHGKPGRPRGVCDETQP